jgi:hypothetical protein
MPMTEQEIREFRHRLEIAVDDVRGAAEMATEYADDLSTLVYEVLDQLTALEDAAEAATG